jgi:hypothetical protein
VRHVLKKKLAWQRVNLRSSPASIFMISTILVSNVTVFFVLFTPFREIGQSVFLMDAIGGKIHDQLKSTALK